MKSAGISSLASPTAVEPEKARAQMERILASPTFGTAKSARRFLRYVVEETLAGRGDQIKEYAVGVSVFDRGFLYGDSVYEVTRAHHGIAFAQQTENPITNNLTVERSAPAEDVA